MGKLKDRFFIIWNVIIIELLVVNLDAEAAGVGFQGKTGEVCEFVVRGEVQMVRKQCFWDLVPKDDEEALCELRGGFPPHNFEVFQIAEGKIEVMRKQWMGTTVVVPRMRRTRSLCA